MIDLGLYTERLKKSDAAEAKDCLLAEAVIGIPTVEMIGELAVPGVIPFDIGIKKEDGDDVSGGPDDVKAPGADLNLTVLESKDDGMARAGERFGRPGHVDLALLTEVGELLPEIAAAMRERNCDHWSRRIGRRPQVCRLRASPGHRSRWEQPGESAISMEKYAMLRLERSQGGGRDSRKAHAVVVLWKNRGRSAA